ncbi:hypothetical protein AB0420_35975 [Streptomyces caelestis]|uniref:Protein NO VEIN C-terminal domain-containing protein n=1 Tax=Streptomyces heliomycini TaxID=284032 RepID=A0ABV5L3N0_9ACTN|nr:hypothetical protein [Streptomyces sp. XY152]KOV35652.1 hypothetical protein ADK58_02725 [Streptomyces sp. XY152]
MQLADRLNDLAVSGHEISFESIGLPPAVVLAEVADVAAGPQAPLLAEAVTHVFDHGEEGWAEAAAQFPIGFARQPSFLHTTAALEQLFNSTAAIQVLAKPLNGALLAGLDQLVNSRPMVAAARLEGAVRLAVSDAVSPIKVWGAIEDLDDSDTHQDFAERLPRIIGLGLDRWSKDEQAITETLRGLLRRLAEGTAGDVDAFVELGYDRLRSALTSRTVADVSENVEDALAWFRTADAAEEARHDAQAYAAVCESLLAFTAGRTEDLRGAAGRLETALEQQSAWNWGMHQPAWMKPQAAADVAWGHLVLQLQRAAEFLQDDVWMEPWEALDHVLSAYQSARTVCTVGARDGSGLAMLVEPAVEDAFLRQQALLGQLRRAVTSPERHPGAGLDHATASSLLARVDQQVTASCARARRESGTDSSGNSGEDAESDQERAHRFAPTAVRKLGIGFTAGLAGKVSDDELKTIDGLAYMDDLTRLRQSDPLVVPLLGKMMEELSAFPDFIGETRRTFGVLVEQTLLFLKATADLDTSTAFGDGRYDSNGKKVKIRDYRRRFDKSQGDLVPLEEDLQQHFHYWLLSGQISNLVQVEPINSALGRADVLVHFGSRRYLTEIKKNHSNNERAYLERHYLAQAAEYSNTNVPFGQLLVLDLTEKEKVGTPRVDEVTWVAKHRPPGATVDRAVVAAVVTGNRYTPSDFS